jgi:hypothetical protein
MHWGHQPITTVCVWAHVGSQYPKKNYSVSLTYWGIWLSRASAWRRRPPPAATAHIPPPAATAAAAHLIRALLLRSPRRRRLRGSPDLSLPSARPAAATRCTQRHDEDTETLSSSVGQHVSTSLSPPFPMLDLWVLARADDRRSAHSHEQELQNKTTMSKQISLKVSSRPFRFVFTGCSLACICYQVTVCWSVSCLRFKFS